MQSETRIPRRTAIRIDPDALTLAPLVLDPSAFQSPLPVQHYHLVFEDEAIGMAVGVWDTTTMQEAFGPYPGDEFITVLDGSFVMIDAEGGAVPGHAGQSVCFRNGIPTSWKQDGYLRKIYLTLNAPGRAVPRIDSARGGVTVLDPGKPTPPGADAPQLYGSSSRTRLFGNDTGTMLVSECRWNQTDIPATSAASHQLVRVLAGSVALTQDDGTVQVFGQGSHFLLPQGARFGWKAEVRTVAWHVDVVSV